MHRQFKFSSIFVLMFSVSGCGGGGDSSTGASSATGSGTTTTTTTTTTVVTSTALASNAAPSNAQFSQFEQHTLLLNFDISAFKSSRIYIKVYSPDNDLLFLGRYHAAQPVSFMLPNHYQLLYCDLFSDDSNDPQLRKEFGL